MSHRALILLTARIRCHWYLFTRGIWRDEYMVETFETNGRTLTITTATGSVWNGTFRETKAFFYEP